jgi:oligopeptide/dipeptide ABC transporter ATP-binding protein
MASVAEQRQAEVGRREPLLKVEHLSKTFKVGGQILRAVDDVTFRIPRGTTLSVVGESGSGKSTLARCILGMLPFDEGSVIYDGASLSTLRSREMRRMREHIQVVFQDPHGSLNRRLPVGEIISAPLVAHGVGTRASRAVRTRELLEIVGLPDAMSTRRPSELSGGQAQRVAIARALALEPEFIVLDEAVSALDVSVRAQVLNLLRRLQDDMSLTYLFITHDLSVARYMAEEVVVMYQGRFVEEGTRSELFDDPRHPYTHRLMDAVATVDPMRRVVRRVALPTSDVGDLLQASGCRFHPRCPIGRELSECQQVDPVATSIDASHLIRCHHPQTVVQWRDIAKAIKE